MNNKKNNGDNFLKYICYFLAIILSVFIVYFVKSQIEHYELSNHPKINELRSIFINFFKKERYWSGKLSMLNEVNLMDKINLYRGDKSYTINKKNIYICLRDENQKYYPMNMLVYVTAHEISHVLCNSVGHTEEFHDIFDALLLELTRDGIYNPSDEIILDYCENGDSF